MKDQGKKLAKWLDKLQQESWQLELVVSGFAIFLMVGALDALEGIKFLQKINGAGLKQQGAALAFGYLVLAVSCFLILINLVLHVLLRGLWISTLGLRYVSGEVNFDVLKLAPRFDRFLRKRVGSFDGYIMQLENICSIVFAFTFLVVFMLIGFAMFFFLFLLLIYILQNGLLEVVSEETSKTIRQCTAILILLTSLLYFIDFVTLGWLKRVRWLSVVYYPIYRFYSFVTLSGLSRPLYYNLVDNKFGRRVGFLMVPYVVGIFILSSFNISSHVWFPDDPGKTALLKSHYDDLREEDRMVTTGSIPTKFVKNGYLELFIRYHPTPDDNTLAMRCPDFEPMKEAGFGSDIQFTNANDGDSTALRLNAPDTALLCLSQLYEIRVGDSLFQNPGLKFYEHPNEEERGLLAILDVAYLPRGQHQVGVQRWKKQELDERDTLMLEPYFSIPFWKE